MKQKVLNIALLVGILLAVVLLIVGIVNTKKLQKDLQ